MRKKVPWMKIAETLRECVVSLDSGPLNNENFDMFYTPFRAPCREDKITRLIFKLQSLHDSYKFILAGHRGVGKSTELLRVSRKCTEYETIFVDASEAMGPKGTGYTNLLLLIANRVIEFGVGGGYLSENDPALEEMCNYWSSELEISKTVQGSNELSRSMGIDASVGGEASSAFNFLNKLKTKIAISSKVSANIASKYERNMTVDEIIHTTIGKSDIEFTGLLNEVLYNLQKALGMEKRLLIIVQEMDKVGQFAMAYDVFIDHAQAFIAIRSDMIYTYPVHLLYSPEYSSVYNTFDDVFNLGVVELLDTNGKFIPSALEAVKGLIYKRIVRNLIEDSALEFAIKMSGGLIRDVFSMVCDAAITAAVDGRESIVLSDVERAAESLEDRYIKFLNIKDGYNTVAELTHSQYPLMTKDLRELLSVEAVLEYSGGRYLVHPLVVRFLKHIGKSVKDYV